MYLIIPRGKTHRIIQRIMKLVIYRGLVETGGKEKEKGDTTLSMYFLHNSDFWNHVNISHTQK